MDIRILAKQYKWWTVAAIAIIIAAVIFFASCKPGDIPFTQSSWEDEVDFQLNDLGIPNENTRFQYEYTTPLGMKVKSTVQVPQDFLVAADEGSEAQIARFKQIFPQFTNDQTTAGRSLLLVTPNRLYPPAGDTTPPSPPCQNQVTEPGSPCLYVRGVQTAGTILGYHDRNQHTAANPPVVMPHQEAQGWKFRQYFVNSVHNENEHRSAWLNRQNQPTGVFYHFQGPNDAHPFQWGTAKSLVSLPVSHCIPGQKN